MKKKNSFFPALSGRILIVLVLLALGYYVRTRPVEIQSRSVSVKTQGDCAVCQGFGTVENMTPCTKCNGTGKIAMKFGRKIDAACPRCKGTGKLAVRGQCPECQGTGKSKEMAESSTIYNVVAMGLSPWERARTLCGLPVDPNPCPQRDFRGGFPLVERYVAFRAGNEDSRVVRCGRFERSGAGWQMTADVEFPNKDGSTRSRTLEFFARDRTLEKSRIIK
jgi:hypothetical protein